MSVIDELGSVGIEDVKKVYHNLDYDKLFELELENKEGSVTDNGTVNVDTGVFTGRSPNDKYFVNEPPSNKYIAWGEINHPVTKEVFDKLFKKAKQQLSGKKLFVEDAFCGASANSKKSIRVISEIAWQAHFEKKYKSYI